MALVERYSYFHAAFDDVLHALGSFTRGDPRELHELHESAMEVVVANPLINRSTIMAHLAIDLSLLADSLQIEGQRVGDERGLVKRSMHLIHELDLNETDEVSKSQANRFAMISDAIESITS